MTPCNAQVGASYAHIGDFFGFLLLIGFIGTVALDVYAFTTLL